MQTIPLIIPKPGKFPKLLCRAALVVSALGLWAIRAAAGEAAVDLSTSSWRLWQDTEAPWEKDTVYLPEDVDLAKLPVNPPTGGWGVLQDQQGIAVSLPSTVEEHFWGKQGLLPYRTGYIGDQHELKCGNYKGVSWWWRSFDAPAIPSGKRLVLTFRGARLRAEVYVNGKLCGYSIFANLPFEADITAAVKPGEKNQLAVRITNAGGNFDWPESGGVINGLKLNAGRGFGGLDADIRMRVRDQVEVSDLAVLNKPELRTVSVLVEVKSVGAAYQGPVTLNITRNGSSCWNGTVDVNVPAGGIGTARTEVSVKDAEFWTLENPALYTASAILPKFSDSGKQTDFGFRWFTAEGIGTSAPKLTFNGKRMVLRSAISWGFWGSNGIFPDQALAEKEVNAAKALGLNCLNFHRDIGRAVMMDTQDRMGLLRYEEPGTALGEMSAHNPPGNNPPTEVAVKGPVDTSGKGGETPTSWEERYGTEKIKRMIKRDRSHPCLIIYSLSNETSPNFKNPRLFAFMRQMQELDPSRIILVKSGNTYKYQCFLLPYDPTFRYDDGTGYSGWYDQHGECVEGAWQDSMYKGPEPFSPLHLHSKKEFDPREIVAWGEAQITALPDNHAKIVADYQATAGNGYDKADHEGILASYEKFLDDYGFRSDFKTADDLFKTIGYKGYFTYQKSIEQMRMLNKTDFIALNGWESTTIENHSGLVDVHRNFKGDPSIVQQSCAPELLVIRPHNYVTAEGQKEIVDVHLINEVNRKGPHTLSLKVVDPNGHTEFETSRPVNVTGGDTYGELLTAGIEFTPETTGILKLVVTLTPQAGGAPLNRTEEMFVVPGRKLDADRVIAAAGNLPWLGQAIQQQTGRPVPELAGNTTADVIVLSWKGDLEVKQWRDGAEGGDPAESDPLMYNWAALAPAANATAEFTRYSGLAKGPVQVELHFVEPANPKTPEAETRFFDVLLNEKKVLGNFNISQESGGKRKVIVRKFTVEAPEGVVSLSFQAIGKQKPAICAIKITDTAGKIIREYAGPEPWKSESGITWSPLVPRVKLLNEIAGDALKKVHNSGTRLILVSENTWGARMMAAALADAGVWTYDGSVGTTIEIWMGSWYFVRKHWLFDGLPSGCSMDWRYQVPASRDTEGLLLAAPGLEVAAGYGRDHKARVGMGAGVVPYGKGQVVFFTMPKMASALNGKPDGLACPVAARLLANAIAGTAR